MPSGASDSSKHDRKNTEENGTESFELKPPGQPRDTTRPGTPCKASDEQTQLVDDQKISGELKLLSLVLFVSWSSVVFSLASGIAGIALSVKGKSESLFAYGLDATLDSLSSVAVVWRFYGPNLYSSERERRACIAIGVAFIISAASLIGKSVLAIAFETHESKEIELYEVFAGICAAVSILLATAKVILGYKTHSQALTNDSIITYVGAASCIAGVTGLEMYINDKDYWYLDSVFGIILGLFLLFFGMRLLFSNILRK